MPRIAGKPAKPRANREELEADAQKILDLKAQGLLNREIRQKLGWDHVVFNTRLKWIKDNDCLRKEALEICETVVARLQKTRKMALDLAIVNAQADPKATTAALKLVADIDKSLPEISDQLKWLEPPEDKHNFRRQDHYAALDVVELEAAYADAVKGVNRAKKKAHGKSGV